MWKVIKFILRISFLVLLFNLIYSAGIFIGLNGTDNNTKEPVLTSYVESFGKDMNISKERMDSIGYGFRSIDPGLVGICNNYLHSISIQPSYWFRTSSLKRISIIYHELAHCVCKIDHIKGIQKDGCAKSLMAPQIMSTSCIKKHWKKYVAEIKEGCKK